MKILMVRSAREIGGAEIYNLNLIKGFRKYSKDVEIFFITTLPEFAKRIEKAGGKAILLPVFSEEVGTKRGLVRLFLNLPKYLFYFLKTAPFLQIKKGVKTAIFQGMTEKITLSPIFKILGFKIIWLEHGSVFAFRRAKEVLFLYKLASQFADGIVTVSEDAHQDIIKGGIVAKKVICVYSGIDTEYFSPREKVDGQKILVMGFLGAICEEKGIKEFLEVGWEVAAKVKGVKFILIGEGPALDWAKEQVKKWGLSKKFTFTGFLRDVRPYLSKFNVLFFPTYHLEGLSLAILEAMGMGVPVVARNIGGNRELVVHGKTGYLFKDETPEELVDIVVDLLKDEKKRKAMGEAARERVMKYFNQERWVKELYSVFEEVAKNEK